MKTRQLMLIGTALALSSLSLPFIISETSPKPELRETPNLELIDELVELGCTEPAINHASRYSNLLDDSFNGTYFVAFVGFPDDLSQFEFDKCVKIILEIRTPNESHSDFVESQWNWHGPEFFVIGKPISFSVSRMNIFCDDVFVAKIVNLDRSKTFWQESSKISCSDIKGGKISQVTFPVNTPIEIDDAGTYFVIVDYADFHGYPMLTKKITIEAVKDMTSSYMDKVIPTLDDFKHTISEPYDIDEIFSKFGQPHYDIGSGIHIFVYKLNDLTEIWIGYTDHILYVKHVDSERNLLEELFVENEN